jgi:hypothetical protein
VGCDTVVQFFSQLFPTQAPQLPQPTPEIDVPINYDRTIQTADGYGTGTDANIYITIYGSQGESPETLLDIPNYNDFEKNALDKYLITVNKDLGNITSVKIRHDNFGIAPGWKLDYITVNNTKTGIVWFFQCSRWLAKDEEDKKIERIITSEGCK